jgi:hypothetical protein
MGEDPAHTRRSVTNDPQVNTNDPQINTNSINNNIIPQVNTKSL